jgi:hypothetical protein
LTGLDATATLGPFSTILKCERWHGASTVSPRAAGHRPTGLESVLGAIVRTAARLCEASDAVIHLVEGDRLRLVAKHGKLAHSEAPRAIRRDMPIGFAMFTRRPLHIADMRTAARGRFRAIVEQGLFNDRVRTVLIMPLLRDGVALGAIIVRRPRVRAFTARQIALLKSFAEQATIAIENARLSQDLESRNRELTEALEQQTATAEILRVISSSPTGIQPTFDAIATAATTLCEADNATVFRFADLFAEVNHGVARDPRARLRVDDGRSFLQTTAERYDVITSEPMPPTFAGVVNLYSREYYQLAWKRLRPGGLLVQWLPFHLVTADQAWSILRSVQDVFPETTLWLHENTGIIVARREQPIVIDVAGLRERVASVREDLRRVAVPDLNAFIELYGLGPAAVADLARRAAAVTDDRPSLEFHSPQHRWQPTWGAFTPSQLEALVAVYTRRAREPLPLTAPLTEEGQALAAAHVGSSYALLGDAYLGAGRSGLARGIYEEGFARAGPPAQRAGFLFALAQIAEKEGRGREAVELVDRGLMIETTTLSDGTPVSTIVLHKVSTN